MTAVASRPLEIAIDTYHEGQLELWQSESTFTGFFGGVGSGKTHAGTVWSLMQPPGSVGIIAAPTHKILHRATVRLLLDICNEANLIKRYSEHKGELELIDGKRIWFASCERPEDLVGANIGWFWLDEIARLRDPRAWQNLIARLRLKPRRAIGTGTPKGKNWVYERWVERNDPSYKRIHASTRANRWNAAGYVEDLQSDYSAEYQRQEIDGEFIDVGSLEMFDEDAVTVVDVSTVPEAALTGPRRARGWDTAATSGGGDFTVGALMSEHDGIFYVLDIVRGQWAPHDRDDIMLRCAKSDAGAMIWVPKGGTDAGVSQVEYWTRMLGDFGDVDSAREVGGRGSKGKSLRANQLAAAANRGLVRIVKGYEGAWRMFWNPDDGAEPLSFRRAVAVTRRELGLFPMGAHDDIVDALVAAHRRLTGGITSESAGRVVYRGGPVKRKTRRVFGLG